MIAFNIAVWTLLVLHFAAVVAVFIGTFRRRVPGAAADPVQVTVVVLPRHDPDLLTDTLHALQLQDYPAASYRIVALYTGPKAPDMPPLRKGDAPVSLTTVADGEESGVELPYERYAEGDGLIMTLPAGYTPRRNWISLMVRHARSGSIAVGFTVAHARRRSAGMDMRNLDRLYWQTVMKGVTGWGGSVAAPAYGICRPTGAGNGVVFAAVPGATLLRPSEGSAGTYLDSRTAWLARLAAPGRAAGLFIGLSWLVKAALAVSLVLCLRSSWQLILTMLYIFIYTGTNLPLLLRGTSLSGTAGALGQAIPHQLAALVWDLRYLPRSFRNGRSDGNQDEGAL